MENVREKKVMPKNEPMKPLKELWYNTRIELDIAKNCLGKFGKLATSEIKDFAGVAKDTTKELAVGLAKVWDELTSTEELTLEDTIKFFVTQKAEYSDPKIAKGAVLKSQLKDREVLCIDLFVCG